MNLKKTAALLCILVLLGTASGCKETSDIKPAEQSNSAYVPTEVTRVTQIGNVGEASSVGNVEVTVNKLYRSKYYGAQDGVLTNIVFLEVTVTNHSDEPIDANMLTSFEFDVDGEPYNTSTLQAISSTQKQFGADVNMLTETLEIGDTQTGYIPAEVPNNFRELTLYCLPLGGADEHYDISQAIAYTFRADEFEDIEMSPQTREESTEAEAAETTADEEE